MMKVKSFVSDGWIVTTFAKFQGETVNSKFGRNLKCDLDRIKKIENENEKKKRN